MISVCLPSDALTQYLPSYLGFSYLGRKRYLGVISSQLLQQSAAAASYLGRGVTPLEIKIRKSEICEVMDMLISLVIAIISECMSISKHQVVYIK